MDRQSANVVDEQTMKHLLVCLILPQPCTHEDLEEFNPELDPAPSIGRESCNDSERRIMAAPTILIMRKIQVSTRAQHLVRIRIFLFRLQICLLVIVPNNIYN